MQKPRFHSRSQRGDRKRLVYSAATKRVVSCPPNMGWLYAHNSINCLHTCKQERCRKSLSVDFAIQLVWRFVYPELLKFTRQGFVAHTARPHRVDQSRLSQLLPFKPNPCLAARFGGRRGCHWSRGLGVKPRIFPNFRRIRLIRRNQQIGFLHFSRANVFGPTC